MAKRSCGFVGCHSGGTWYIGEPRAWWCIRHAPAGASVGKVQGKRRKRKKKKPKPKKAPRPLKLPPLTPIEDLLAKAMDEAGIAYTAQHQVDRRRGLYYLLDFAVVSGKRKLAVECDGHDFHHTQEQRERDCRRQRELCRRGWTVYRFTGREIWRDARACAGEISRMMGRKKSTPTGQG